jgi:hypothetical protein
MLIHSMLFSEQLIKLACGGDHREAPMAGAVGALWSPRDPEASIRLALRDVPCLRCNGQGRPRIAGLARHPSI